MSAEVFLDTNVLLYAATAAASEAAKQDRAYKLIAEDNFGISTQVLQEFYYNATVKARHKMLPEKALEFLAEMDHRPCAVVDGAVFHRAIQISILYKITYWDGALLAAAEALGAAIVFSEYLNHGQSYGAIKVLNPFK